MVRKSKLAYRESIADLWGWPDCNIPKRPDTKTLFEAIAGEALACLSHADWEDRIHRMENIISVIKSRIRLFWEEQHETELDRLVNKAKEEVRIC